MTLRLIRKANGQLSLRRSKQEGEGVKEIYDAVKKKGKDILLALTGFRTKASPKVRSFLEKNGSSTIVGIKVGRKPIESWIDRVTNWISGGKWDENKKKLNYDAMFHLYMIISLDNGIKFKLEKNHVVEIKPVVPFVQNEEQIDVKTPSGKTTLAEFIAKAEKHVGADKLWIYDGFRNMNCQAFVRDCLSANKVWDTKVARFVLQNAEGVVEGFPWFKDVARKITDIAHKADIVINGEGKKKRKYGVFIAQNKSGIQQFLSSRSMK